MRNYFSSLTEKEVIVFFITSFAIPMLIGAGFSDYIEKTKYAYDWQYDDLKQLIESKKIEKDDEFLQEILKDEILTKNEYSRLIDYIENKNKDKKKKEFFEWLNGRK